MKTCPKCGIEFDSKKKYCSDLCKEWHNIIRKENESHLPPVKKRTSNFFRMVVGSTWSNKGQGKRSSGMVTGGMSARVEFTTEEIAEVNEQNIRRHFSGIPGYQPEFMKLGDGTCIKKDQVETIYGFRL